MNLKNYNLTKKVCLNISNSYLSLKRCFVVINSIEYKFDWNPKRMVWPFDLGWFLLLLFIKHSFFITILQSNPLLLLIFIIIIFVFFFFFLLLLLLCWIFFIVLMNLNSFFSFWLLEFVCRLHFVGQIISYNIWLDDSYAFVLFTLIDFKIV